ncbi:MAG TPA: efflux RND transporter periplasmic adaptor subunit [Allosphingosinicella sp.]|nr:efflux RND transporter periplasmic adaptor subunit [Allosphingosinicella sp.]
MIVVAALVLIAAAFFMFGMGGGDEKTSVKVAAGGGNDKGAAPAVTVVVPGHQQVARLINATGTLGARRDMPVGIAGEGGRVVSVLVEPGQWVGAGQTLAVIDRSVQSQESAQLAAQIEVSRADARLAQQELERAQALVSRGFVSKADVERRMAARDAANARVRVAQATLGASRARIGRLDVRAPAAGLVLDRNVEPGQIVSAGSGALFRIAKGGEMEMLAKLPETDLAQVRGGVPASVTPVGSARSYQGTVWQVSPIIDPQTRQGIVRISVPYDRELRPGGFAAAEIKAGAVEAPLLPESAVQSDDKGNFVYIVDQKNEVVRRPVRIGDVSGAGVAIVEGLNGTERVVLSAGAFLNPGDKVRPQRPRAK